jgi:hypothetical protein
VLPPVEVTEYTLKTVDDLKDKVRKMIDEARQDMRGTR